MVRVRTAAVWVACVGLVPRAVFGGFATEVVSYVQGTGLSSSDAKYNNPETALGSPERMTGIGTPYPSVVSAFSPVFMTNQAVSIGEGGSLTVHFNTPIVDDASHLYGVDLLVFGNSGFIIDDFTNLKTGTPAGLFGPGAGKVEISADGVNFFEVPNAFADQLFPTQGYLDGGPFDATPGSVPSNFYKPVNPALTMDDFSGKTYSQILALYDGSGGGLPIDLTSAVDAFGQPAGLTSASYVRVSQTGAGDTQIDAFVAIPEPAALGLMVLAAAGLIVRRSTRTRG